MWISNHKFLKLKCIEVQEYSSWFITAGIVYTCEIYCGNFDELDSDTSLRIIDLDDGSTRWLRKKYFKDVTREYRLNELLNEKI
jgi:hypothetical protein